MAGWDLGGLSSSHLADSQLVAILVVNYDQRPADKTSKPTASALFLPDGSLLLGDGDPKATQSQSQCRAYPVYGNGETDKLVQLASILKSTSVLLSSAGFVSTPPKQPVGWFRPSAYEHALQHCASQLHARIQMSRCPDTNPPAHLPVAHPATLPSSTQL